MPNRLALARSPYLLQHADNPVDWHEWGEEAFARARAEDKPIFLSIGYSTCHWCHVMAHESFEDPDVAAALNGSFVPIKVDREERPDVDRVYMLFVQATTGSGGWPMSVWLTPGLKPFFGGTYFPPTSRWGRPGFIEVLDQLSRAWRDDRADVMTSADRVLERLRDASGADAASAAANAGVADRAAVEAGVAEFARAFDERHGGFGAAPKFPRPSELLFLLRAHALTGEWAARRMALETLHAMAMGGVRDQIGGGFHRYSVDAEWRVPHFEKMLYDQAQLVLAYLEASQVSGDAFYAAVAEDTLAYVARDLTAPGGGFFSAEDADSLAPGGGEHGHAEKREGAFYVWTHGEFTRLLGDDAPIAAKRFGVEPAGNAPSDPQGEFTGQNILYVAQSIEDVSVRTGAPIDDVMAAIGRTRQTLFDARAERPRPHLDDKVLTAWNGLMIAAFARAARVLVDSPHRQEWRRAAEGAAGWIRQTMWKPSERRLLRTFRDGQAAIDGFCEDYAYLSWGLLELFQTTGDVAWLEWARDLTTIQRERFFDARDGGWFSTTGQDASVLLRLKEDYDGAEPAAASVTVQNLITLGHLSSDTAFLDLAEQTLARYGPGISRAVRVMPFMVADVALWSSGGVQIAVAGDAAAADTRALEHVVASRYLPFAVVAPVAGETDGRAPSGSAPWLAAMTRRDGRATAYLCRGFACEQPTSDPAVLAAQLDTALGGRIVR